MTIINKISEFKIKNLVRPHLSFTNTNLSAKKNIELKILLIGDSQVGKTTLLLAYFQGVFSINLDSTFRGVNLFRKQISINSKANDIINYFINIWDVAGSDNYIDFFSLITQPMDAIVILSKDKKRFNLEITVKKWTDIINKYVSSDFLTYLIVGDFDFQEIDEDLKEKFHDSYKISKHFLINVKNIPEVTATFDKIFSEIIEKRKNELLVPIDH